MDRKVVELLLSGHSMRQVMRQLGVGDRRIKKIRYQAESYGYLGKVPLVVLPPYPEALFVDGPDGREAKGSASDELLASRRIWISERLAAGWYPITVFEELGLPIGRSSFYRFLHRHNLVELGDNARRRVVPEIVHRPGEALLLDWGKLRDVTDLAQGKKRTLWAFVGVLGYSRYMMVRLVWSNNTSTTLAAIGSMLQEIGGVPERVTSDNPKCFSLEASRYEPLLNPVFERMAGHYGMRIECLPPADPEKKGKVERLMPYVRRLYQAHGDVWHGIEESQRYLDNKVMLANERVHGTTRMKPIGQLLTVETTHLKSLPALLYEAEETSKGIVRRDGHVRFDSKYYSLDEKLIGSEVFILASSINVSIYHQGKLAEVHERISVSDPLHAKSTKKHHLKPWEREMQNGTIYRQRAQKIGPDVERLVAALLNAGSEFVDIRKIWGVLSLDKSFTPATINEACRQAMALGTLSYRAVKSLLRVQPTEPTHTTICMQSSAASATAADIPYKFVRPMSVYKDELTQLH